MERKFSSIITKVEGLNNQQLYLLRRRNNVAKAMFGKIECPEEELEEEETYQQAAEREFYEETNIKIKNIKECFKFEMEASVYERSWCKRIITVYETTISLGEVADITNKQSIDNEPWEVYTEDKVMLMESIDSIREYLERKFDLKHLPRLLIFEGADGTGKTTIIEKIKRKMEEKGLGYSHNKNKVRRSEGESMLSFRERVTEQRNQDIMEGYMKKIINGEDCAFVITDKSPYVEYFYQKTKWNHERLDIFQNHQLEKKIFELKSVIDSAIVIHLKNDKAWENYINREDKIVNKSFETMSQETYKQMKENFEKFAPKLYKHHFFVKIENDENSWRRVWDIIKFTNWNRFMNN